MDNDVIVTLLTAAVILLSIVIVALLAAVTIVLVKLNHVMKSVNLVTNNLASATEWLVPARVFGHVTRLFRGRGRR